jgi:AcrR family transcriptional regulator
MSVMSGTSVGEERRSQILDAAAAIFLQYGYRRSTIEEIARQSKMSRPALYQYFDDKSDVFRGVIARLNDQVLGAAQLKLHEDGPLSERIAGAVQAKYASVVELVGKSPHAAELFDRNDTIAGDLAKDAHARLEKMIHHELLRAQERGEIDMKAHQISALATARLIDHAVQGIAQHALTSTAAWPSEVFQLVDLVIRGLRAE